MMEQIQGDDPIESKAIQYVDNDTGTRVPMIVTVFDEEDNEVLDTAGYRGRYVIFALIEGGVQEAFSDPYKAQHSVVSGDVRDFIFQIRRGWKTHGKDGLDWSNLQHGQTYNKYEMDF